MDYALIRDLLDEHLTRPLEGTILTPHAFDIEINHEQRPNVTRVKIEGSPGWYCFDLIHDENLSANGSLRTQPGFRRRGIGSSLVHMREDLCVHEGIETIVIGENFRDRFWEQRDYQHIPGHELVRLRYLHQKQLVSLSENGSNSAQPRYKKL